MKRKSHVRSKDTRSAGVGWAVSRSKTKTATRYIFGQPQPAPLPPRKAAVCAAHGGARCCLSLASRPSLSGAATHRPWSPSRRSGWRRCSPWRPRRARNRNATRTPRPASTTWQPGAARARRGRAFFEFVRRRRCRLARSREGESAIGPKAHTVFRGWPEPEKEGGAG